MPSPLQIIMALVGDFTLLMYHLVYTLAESILGLVLGVILGLIFALLKDRFLKLYKIFEKRKNINGNILSASENYGENK